MESEANPNWEGTGRESEKASEVGEACTALSTK